MLTRVKHSVANTHGSVHGTYIQEKACSLVWHYADCDQDWGAMQARELTDHLEDILETDEVEIIPGQCRVEVWSLRSKPQIRTPKSRALVLGI